MVSASDLQWRDKQYRYLSIKPVEINRESPTIETQTNVTVTREAVFLKFSRPLKLFHVTVLTAYSPMMHHIALNITVEKDF